MDVAYNGQLVAFSTNTYNALGQRVRDVAPLYGTTTDEAYDPGGNLLWGYAGASNSWSYVPFNGHTLAEEYSYSGGSGTIRTGWVRLPRPRLTTAAPARSGSSIPLGN